MKLTRNCCIHICGQVMGWRNGGVKQILWANYLFPGVNKTGLVTRLAPSTIEEIAERISALTSSYITESNEDTFKSDVIFESFHHQAKVPISYRALLASFLMLWLKRCVVPTLPTKWLSLMWCIRRSYLLMGSPLPSFQQYWLEFRAGCEH